MPQAAHTVVKVALVHLSRKAALFNKVDYSPAQGGEPTIWIPYSVMENPDILDQFNHNPINLKVQLWFARKEGLVK